MMPSAVIAKNANATLTSVNPVAYAGLVPETTGNLDWRPESTKADNRRPAVFFRPRIKCLLWSGLGGRALALAGFLCCRYANPAMFSATTIGVVGRVIKPNKGGRTMRQALVRPQQAQTTQSFFTIPDPVLALLDTRADDYGTGCNIGRQAADEFAECLRDERYRIGFGLLPRIAEHMATTGSSHGIAVGFYARLDELLVRASSPGIFTAFQQPSSAGRANGSRARA